MTLKSLRKAKRLTQEEVEAITGITSSYLSRLESGTVKNPGIDTIYKLSKAYNIGLTELVEQTQLVQSAR